jgi:hypothetical protein
MSLSAQGSSQSLCNHAIDHAEKGGRSDSRSSKKRSRFSRGKGQAVECSRDIAGDVDSGLLASSKESTSSNDFGIYGVDNGSILRLMEETDGITHILVKFNLHETFAQKLPSLHVHVADVKLQLRNQLGMSSSPMKVHLVFGSERLVDDRSLASYGLESGSTVELVLSLQGGGDPRPSDVTQDPEKPPVSHPIELVSRAASPFSEDEGVIDAIVDGLECLELSPASAPMPMPIPCPSPPVLSVPLKGISHLFKA